MVDHDFDVDGTPRLLLSRGLKFKKTWELQMVADWWGFRKGGGEGGGFRNSLAGCDFPLARKSVIAREFSLEIDLPPPRPSTEPQIGYEKSAQPNPGRPGPNPGTSRPLPV